MHPTLKLQLHVSREKEYVLSWPSGFLWCLLLGLEESLLVNFMWILGAFETRRCYFKEDSDRSGPKSSNSEI